MNHTPLVSIVTPCIRPQFIGRAVQSVLNQTYQNFEMLVVNDGGEDFAALLEAFDDRRIRYLRHEQRRGRSAARNTAFQNARGKYIAYLDDDDYYYPNHLQMLVEFLENSDYRVAYTDGYQTFETDETGRWEIFRRDLCYSNDFSLDLFLVDNILDTNALMHERACLFKVGFFDQNLPIHEDWDLWLRIAIQYPFFHIRQLTHEYSTRRGGDHARLYWLGEVLSTCLVVQHRYQQWSSPAIQAQQEARRKFLAEGAVNQLYSYPLHRLKASQIPQTTRLIVERSQVHGNGADRERAYQVANALAYRLPEEETVWVSLAKSLRFLGHPEAGLEAIDRALGLRVTKEALVEQLYLSRALDRSTDATTQLRVFQAQFPDMPLPPEYPEPLPYLLPELPPYQEFVADPSGIPSAPHIDRPTLTPQSITFLWQRDRRIRELVDWVEQLAH
ncbi:MAG: glycosyltransferase, partial [Leptolyngbyaceae cyanobacterium bins.59]|nr:glycosyltransferase [Leptolyngbyaceae cyanobacterium bins.59]